MTADAGSRFASRDATLDLAREACVLMVVVAHLVLRVWAGRRTARW